MRGIGAAQPARHVRVPPPDFRTLSHRPSARESRCYRDPVLIQEVLHGCRIDHELRSRCHRGSGVDSGRVVSGRNAVRRRGAAYDEYAIDAFERGAVDYLLKPIVEDRLRATVERLRAAIARPPADLSGLLAQLAGRLQPPSTGYLAWVRAGVGETVRLIAIEDVLFFQAGDKYTRVVTRTGEAWIRTPIKELATTLDPARFWQVHRGTLVNVREIAAMARTNRDSGELQLKDHPERLDVSRAYLHLFRQM